MARGQQPKPVELHILEGTYRKYRHAGTPLADGVPEMPKSFNDRSVFAREAKAFWERTVPRLMEKGIVGFLDTTYLTVLCEWWARYRKFSAALDRVGATNKKAAKLILLADLACREVDRIGARFGLTPVDRARLRLPAKPHVGVMTRKRRPGSPA